MQAKVPIIRDISVVAWTLAVNKSEVGLLCVIYERERDIRTFWVKVITCLSPVNQTHTQKNCECDARSKQVRSHYSEAAVLDRVQIIESSEVWGTSRIVAAY